MPTLHWLTRETDLLLARKAPYRLLETVPEMSFGDPSSENMLTQGDNLDALKALLPYYAGRIKCIYIDPPYNTKSAFEHYDDNLEHAKWLSMMYPRLELLRELLSEDGSIWVSIDDNEGHYLKTIMDEVFGMRNFIASIIWEKRTSRENRAAIGSPHPFRRTEEADERRPTERSRGWRRSRTSACGCRPEAERRSWPPTASPSPRTPTSNGISPRSFGLFRPTPSGIRPLKRSRNRAMRTAAPSTMPSKGRYSSSTY